MYKNNAEAIQEITCYLTHMYMKLGLVESKITM